MFKVQLIKIEEKFIKDDKTGKKSDFKVANFIEWAKNENGIEMPTGAQQKRWFRYDDDDNKKVFNDLNLKEGNFYQVKISFEYKIIDISDWTEAKNKNIAEL